VLGLAFFLPSGSYLILPDGASPLAPVVKVEGEQPADDAGGIFYVDVRIRKASLLEELLSPLRPDGSELVPDHAIVPPGTDFAERRRQNLRQMDRSQEIAAAVALRARGLAVTAEPEGALVVAVAPDVPAAKQLRPTDVIVAADGTAVRTPGDLRRLIGERDPGKTVRLRVRAGGAVRTENVRTIESPDEPGRAIVGIQVEQSARIELPIEVEIDLGDVGGPSAGLAFALDVLEELGRDVDRGYRVAATGELELDGDVAPIGGIVQKTLGAREAGIEVFLVPAGDNARDARRNANGLRIIAVDSFQQALQELATLPRKA
jgi:Lon-like protease